MRKRVKKTHVLWPDDDVILYDGVCIFCSRWVRFVATRDTGTASASPRSSRLTVRGWRRPLASIPTIPTPTRSFTAARRDFKSDAALTVLALLPGWGWTRVLFAVPKPLRDAVYSLVARNRYRIFGKYEECFVPDAEMRARVME